MLGAYPYGEFPPDKTLTVYGSQDQILDRSKINYKEHITVIEGGIHAQFGNCGEQKGDRAATVSSQEQQEQTVQAIAEFISRENRQSSKHLRVIKNS